MPAFSRLQYFWLAYLSRPAQHRTLYRLIRRRKPRQIVEMGLGDGQRTLRMIRLAARLAGPDKIHYVGVDLFEARPAGTQGLSLKQAHRLLKSSPARVQLVPGDPLAALTRMANALGNTDLVVVSADQDPESLAKAWFYVPRMLHARSCVLEEFTVEGSAVPELRSVDAREIRRRAGSDRTRRAA